MNTALSTALVVACLTMAGCATTVADNKLGDQADGGSSALADKPFASTYQIPLSKPFVLRNVIALTGAGTRLDDVDILVSDGKIQQLGNALIVASDVQQIAGQGRWVTPGIIDVHSHMGVYSQPGIESHSDGNEVVSPNTAYVWAEHSVWPQDPAFEKALAGGVTTAQILPGSANLFGGRGVTLKNVPSISMQGMKYPGAPHSLKMACGENPKRVYGDKGGPGTRMGNMAGYRTAWIEAADYRDKMQDYQDALKKGDDEAEPPQRDLKLETLAGVLNGEIRVHNHCYRADEMVNMIDLAKEFGYSIAAFHHAVEAYKVAPILAENGVCAVVWADWWGFKQEAADMVRENAALVDYVKGCAIIHSDDDIQIQRLNQEVAKVMQASNRMGLPISRAKAIGWITSNPAKSLGLEEQIGSLEEGKNADIVLWSGDPFSIYSKADKVWIDGSLRYDRAQPGLRPTADFNLGVLTPEENRP